MADYHLKIIYSIMMFIIILTYYI